MPDSIGRLDDVLYPFYRNDMAEGRLTKELAGEYIAELLIKIFAHIGCKAHRSGDNTLVVGGYTSDGSDGFTELSELILKIRTALPIWRPQISFRYTKNTPIEVIRLVTKLNAECNDITFSNDEVYLCAFERLGIPRDDAIDYTKIGCNEWAVMGKSNTGSDGFFNTVAPLEEMLLYNTDIISELKDFESFYSHFLHFAEQYIGFMCDLADLFFDANAGDINVLSSLIIEGCIEKAESLTRGGAKYNASCWSAIGIINLADSLSVIRQFVYDEKYVDMNKLITALKADWAGCEALRGYIIKNGHFFGNGDGAVDSLLNRLIADFDAIANKRQPKKGGRYVFGCYTGYNASHITMGQRTMATPDGRHSGDPFTAAISAQPGYDKNGVTAFLKSASGLNYDILCGPLAVKM